MSETGQYYHPNKTGTANMYGSINWKETFLPSSVKVMSSGKQIYFASWMFLSRRCCCRTP